MMARNYASLASSRSEYARALPGVKGGFRGVDFSSSPHQCEPYRLPESQNMYRDYRSTEGGALETIPGFRPVESFNDATEKRRINGIYRLDDGEGDTYLIVHAGSCMWLVKEGEAEAGKWTYVADTLADSPSRAFVYNGVLYILDGKTYQRLEKKADGAYALVRVMENAYVPKTMYMGEQYEQRNMLTDKYRVATLGSEGVQAPSSEDHFSTEKKYVGKDTFVVMPRDYTLSYVMGCGASVLVFSAGGNGYNVTISSNSESTEDTTVTALAVISNGSDGGFAFGGTLENFKALRRLYLQRRSGGSAITVNEDCRWEMKQGGQIFFDCAISGFGSMFADTNLALTALPPNIVLRVGGSVQTAQPFAMQSANASILGNYTSKCVIAAGALPDAVEANKLYVHNGENGCIAVTAGADVPAGRYYAYGRFFDENALLSYLLLRIEVVAAETADESLPTPVQDVFEYEAKPLVFQLPERTGEVYAVADEEYEADFGGLYDAHGNITAIGAMVRGGTNEITIEAKATDYHIKTGDASFYEANPDYKGTSEEAINGCTLCALYDDRVFLAGNPALPNTVFYSARNDVGVSDPAYFGILNYFNDGVGWDRVTALFPFSDTLCVAKRNTVYYHRGADGTDLVPRVYPSERGNAGLGSLGACCNFLDDPVMLTKEGVWGHNKETLTLERTLGRRSATVDARLLTEENLAAAEMVEWEGYLCLFVNGHVYMADSRTTYTDQTGNVQYEWFYLSDIGVWRDESGLADPLYAAVTGELVKNGVSLAGEIITRDGVDYPLCETHEELLFSDAYSASVQGEEILYAVRDGKAYAVYATGELEKTGSFYPAVHPLVVEGRLYFGTDTGEVFVFNNDKRGVAVNGDAPGAAQIHRSFYSFAGHRIDSGFLTSFDNCDIPHLCKSTSPRSLTVRAKLLDGASYSVAVLTERGCAPTERFAISPFSFGGLDLGAVSFHAGSGATVVGKEKEKRWVEKQYLFLDGGFCRPFGIYSIAYRYRIAGRIRE